MRYLPNFVNIYETPVKASFSSPMLSNMQSMKTDLHSNLAYDECLLTDEDEEPAQSLFSSFLEELCGPSETHW